MTLDSFNGLSDQNQVESPQNAAVQTDFDFAKWESRDSADRAEKSAADAGLKPDPKRGKKPTASPRERREACARATRDALVRHALYRLGDKSPKPLNWRSFGYCMTVIALMIRPGRHYEARWHKGVMLRGKYYWWWPEATTHAFLAEIGLGCEGAITESALEALEDGIDAAKRRKSVGFMRADTMAEMLDVDRAERELLKFWHIGAVDFPKEERDAANKKAKQQRDERRRRAAGATPRSNSFAAVKPWLYFGEKRTPYYERPEAERLAMLAEAIKLRRDGEKPPRKLRSKVKHRPTSIEGQAPWKRERISRRTWYRRKAGTPKRTDSRPVETPDFPAAGTASNSQNGTPMAPPSGQIRARLLFTYDLARNLPGEVPPVPNADNMAGRAPLGRATAMLHAATDVGEVAAVNPERAAASITLQAAALSAAACPRVTSAPLAAHRLQDNQHCAAASLFGAKEELSAFRLTVEQDGCPPASSSLRAVLAAWGIAA
jgi:hypothetical protein